MKSDLCSLSNDYLYHMDTKNDNQVNIELSEDIATGVYSNLAILTHSPTEFVADFIQLMPGMPKGKVRSRVIMTLHAMKDNIQKYEQTFGVIDDGNVPPMPPMNFGTPTTEA